MKRLFITLLFMWAACRVSCQPAITALDFPSTVGLFDLYEISFKLGHYTNPYDPDTIRVYAVFSGPGNICDTVQGFYYEGYNLWEEYGYENSSEDTTQNAKGWRIRYTPTATGLWNFVIRAVDKNGTTMVPGPGVQRQCIFSCTSVTNASGFISKANGRYLKRDVVRNGTRQYRSFFPVGPNIAWYGNNQDYSQPYGIYDYERYVDSLSGNGNYMRIWINRYQYLNLYGPEYTQNQTVYFDSTLNQKDAAELDHILTYAAQHDVAVMVSIFNYADFSDHYAPNTWSYNPFNYNLESIQTPYEFFTDAEAKRITRNLIRYIVARWGYATNVMCWELWNEVNKTKKSDNQPVTDMVYWHDEMREYIQAMDPFDHLVSTSTSGYSSCKNLYLGVFNNMDIVQQHRYSNVKYAEPNRCLSWTLFRLKQDTDTAFPSTPFFIGEFGSSCDSGVWLQAKDPWGVELHSSLWASLFSASMGPASFWRWYYVDTCGLYNRFKPVLEFCNNLPGLSGSFTPHTTAIPRGRFLDCENGLLTYYMKNASEDTLYGWCQDTSFCYQSLRRLTDSVFLEITHDTNIIEHTEYVYDTTFINNDTVLTLDSTYIVYDTTITEHRHWMFVDTVVLDPSGYVYTLDPLKRPGPSSNSNKINLPVTNQPVGSRYNIQWYDSETGAVLNTGTTSNPYVHQDPQGNRYITIKFPSVVRNLQQHTVNNRFGDAVFKLTYKDWIPMKTDPPADPDD